MPTIIGLTPKQLRSNPRLMATRCTAFAGTIVVGFRVREPSSPFSSHDMYLAITDSHVPQHPANLSATDLTIDVDREQKPTRNSTSASLHKQWGTGSSSIVKPQQASERESFRVRPWDRRYIHAAFCRPATLWDGY